jgi:regulator of replication initiation timing
MDNDTYEAIEALQESLRQMVEKEFMRLDLQIQELEKTIASTNKEVKRLKDNASITYQF